MKYAVILLFLFASSIHMLSAKVDNNVLLKVNGNSASTNQIEAGIYTLSYQIWLEQSCSISTIYTYLTCPWLTSSWDLSTIEKGKWVKLEKEITLESEVVDQMINFFVPNQGTATSELGNFFVDDVKLERIGQLTQVIDTVSEIKIYPNPASDFLMFCLNAQTKVDIYNLSGQLCETLELNAGKNTISFSHFQSGLYFVKLNTAGKPFTTKIIKY